MASENKDEMAKHASWSEGILGDKAAPSAVAYSWIDRNVPVSGRTHMLLADLTAGVHARNPGLSVQQAVLAAAKDMVQKGVATSDLRTFVQQGGRFSRPGAPDTFAVEDRFYFGKGRKERFADDVYLDLSTARHLAYDLQKVVGSMKPMGESRMDAAIVQALGQLTKISATLQQPKFVSISTLKAMMRQVDGLAKQFGGLGRKYAAESVKLRDESRALQRGLGGGRPNVPLGSRDSREYTRKSGELLDRQKNIENLVVLMQEAGRIENALAPIAKRYM